MLSELLSILESTHLGYLILCVDKDTKAVRSKLIASVDLVMSPEKVAFKHTIRDGNTFLKGCIHQILIKLAIINEQFHVKLEWFVLLNALIEVIIDLLHFNLDLSDL